MESQVKIGNPPLWFDPYASVRTDLYVLLGALLGRPPSEELQKVLLSLDWNEAIPDRLSQALQTLSQAGQRYPLAALEEEYDQLFVGLGSGEIVPYASWYKEKRIQSKPLASVRSDLIRLGIVRQRESHEPEDHAAALCEVMALISQKSTEVPLAAQADFFREHISSWMPNFFKDLQSAKRAEFYKKVGLFGSCFVESEGQYLEFYTLCQSSRQKGGEKDETGIYG
jgi:TorA maturation chaperone TorD